MEMAEILKSVKDLQRQEKTIELAPGLVLTLSTLGYGEQLDCMSELEKKKDIGNVQFMQEAQMSTLARATRSVNGKVFSLPEMTDIYKSMQFTVVQKIHEIYAEMLKQQESTLEYLKKN